MCSGILGTVLVVALVRTVRMDGYGRLPVRNDYDSRRPGSRS